MIFFHRKESFNQSNVQQIKINEIIHKTKFRKLKKRKIKKSTTAYRYITN